MENYWKKVEWMQRMAEGNSCRASRWVKVWLEMVLQEIYEEIWRSEEERKSKGRANGGSVLSVNLY